MKVYVIVKRYFDGENEYTEIVDLYKSKDDADSISFTLS